MYFCGRSKEGCDASCTLIQQRAFVSSRTASLHCNPSLLVAPDPSRLSRVFMRTLFEESWLPALLLHTLIFARCRATSLQESAHLRRTEDTWP